MRNALPFVVLALAIAAAAVAASVVLLGSTGGNDRVGNLSPVASLPSVTVRTSTAPPPPARTTRDRHAGGEDD